MKSCFGYIRVSTAKQGEGVSLEAQRDAIIAYAERNNIAINRWYEEKETAAKSGRPIFNGMIRALMRGGAEGLVMHKIDRSARNFADWAKIGELADSGIGVYFATETLDFRSRGGRLSADIQAVIAADYIRNLRDETMKGIEGRLKQGLYPFRAPIGYLDCGGGKPKTPDPDRAHLVRAAFQMYATGQHSLRSLCKELEKTGLRNHADGSLSKRGLELLLCNPFYCGLVKIRRTGEVYQGVHKPIVSVSLYEAVQAVRAGKSGKKVTKHNHLFRGLFTCQMCNFTLSPELQKGRVYYRCHTQGCSTKTIREDVIESSVLSALRVIDLTTDDKEKLSVTLRQWCYSYKNDDKIRTAGLNLAKVEKKLEKLTDALIDRLIDIPTFTSRKEKLLFERSRANEVLALLKKQPDPDQVQKFLELIINLAALYTSARAQEKRQIIELATSNRVVQGKCVEIEPANWLTDTRMALTGFIGDPSRPTSRSGHQMLNLQMDNFGERIQLPEVIRLRNLFQTKTDTQALIRKTANIVGGKLDPNPKLPNSLLGN